MSLYLQEFLLLYSINLFNLISPGAGFAIVAKNSISYSRKYGIFTAFGIVASTTIFKSLLLLKFDVFVSQVSFVFLGLKYCGGIYLIYLGYASFIAYKINKYEFSEAVHNKKHLFSAFRTGFLTDFLNPQSSLSFLCIITATVSFTTPLQIRSSYALILLLTSLFWYISIALVFTTGVIYKFITNYNRFFNIFAGGMFTYLGLKLILSSSH